MSTENLKLSTTIQALEDLRTLQYHAIALNDGKLANNGEEASGILLNKPNNKEHASVAYGGELKYNAGGAISAGAKLTVSTSGWFTTAGSLDPVVGEAKLAVTSGSQGTGLFFFPQVTDKAQFSPYSVTPKDDLIAGIAIALDDLLVADNGEEADGVTLASMSSGTAADVGGIGIMPLRMAPAECSSLGDVLTVITSGYFSIGDSGDYICAKAISNIGSNSTGNGLFFGQGYYLSV